MYPSAGAGHGKEEDVEYTYGAMARESAVLVLLSTTCYLNSLWGEFVFDDIIAVMENKDVRPETPLEKVCDSID